VAGDPSDARKEPSADTRSSAAPLRWAGHLAGTPIPWRRYRGFAIWGVLLAELVVWTLLSPSFLSLSNFTNVARQSSLVGIVAVGGTMVIIVAGIDLSVGSLTALAGILAAGAMTRVDNAMVGICVAMAVGLLSGLFAGLVITRFKVPPFIVTLAMLQMWQALTLLFNNGGPIEIVNDPFQWLGTGYVGPIPFPVCVMAVVYLCGGFILTQTKFGRRAYAIGGNRAAAEYAGIAVDRNIIAVYIIAGFLTSIGAILVAGRLGTASPLTGQGLELDVIAAIVVGGASIFGGEGNLLGTLAGVLIIAFLRNGLTLVDVSSFWQQLVIGVVILLAVLIDRQIRSRG
jgi:ribose/xylose/arabinose/galactoside ABC-type transport system permease subunit